MPIESGDEVKRRCLSAPRRSAYRREAPPPGRRLEHRHHPMNLLLLSQPCLAPWAHEPGAAGATSTNGTASNLISLFPNLYGPTGIVLLNTAHAAHFTNAFQSNFSPLVGSIVNQLTTIPIPSPASGFLYT